MDIDDILAEVSVPKVPEATRDLQDLTRLWVAERGAPEVLPYPEALMERVTARIRRQIEHIEDLTASPNPSQTFPLIILQTELERFKYLIRSYLRTRISKLDAHAQHYLAAETKPSPLSATEEQYLTAHHALLSEHYKTSFLGQFPPSLQRLDDRVGTVGMVDGPDVEAAVFVRGLRDIGILRVPGRPENDVDVRKGDIVIVRWSTVRSHVLAGDAELV